MALKHQVGHRRIGKYIVSGLIIFFLLGTFLAIPRASVAGGLYLNEFGTPSMGVAGAGARTQRGATRGFAFHRNSSAES